MTDFLHDSTTMSTQSYPHPVYSLCNQWDSLKNDHLYMSMKWLPENKNRKNIDVEMDEYCDLCNHHLADDNYDIISQLKIV